MAESRKYIRLRTYNDDYHQAYVELADHPHELKGCVHRSVWVHNLIEDYDGPGISLHFDEKGRAIGIEILYPYEDDHVDEEE